VRSGNDGGDVEQPDNRLPDVENGCPQIAINECEEHCKSSLDTVRVVVDLGRTEKLKFYKY
jgi:hypothetical protein